MSFPPPAFVQLYPTIRCNQRCHFCFNVDALKAPLGGVYDLSFTRALRLLDILESNGVMEIDIMGGEPLMLPWMSDFVASSLKKRLAVNISTNGSDTRALSGFRNVKREKCRIGISLEGSNADRHNLITNSSHFDTALENIRRLVSWGLDPIAKTVLTRGNSHDIQDIVTLLKGLGVRSYYVIHMDLLSEDSKLTKDVLGFADFVSYYRKLKDSNPEMGIFKVHASCFARNLIPAGVRCAGGVRKLSVLPDGSVFPCNLFHGFKEFNLGNIFEDSFPSIWNSPILETFRKHTGNTCSTDTCPHRTSCTGGCPAHSYYHYGQTEGTDIRCMLSQSVRAVRFAAVKQRRHTPAVSAGRKKMSGVAPIEE